MIETKVPPEVAWIFVAIFGGIAKFFDLYLQGKEAINIWRFVALLVVSGFSGYMTATVVAMYYPQWVTVAAGIGGFAGTRMIEMGMDIVRTKLGAKKEEP